MKLTDTIKNRYSGEVMCDRRTLQEVLDGHALWVKSGGGLGIRAKLRQAGLSNTDFRNTDLRCTNLSYADLSHADFSGVSFHGANFHGADFFNATLIGTNLSKAKNIISFGPVGDERRTGYAVKHDDCVMVKLGCFWGKSSEAIRCINEKYGKGSGYASIVRAAVKCLKEK